MSNKNVAKEDKNMLNSEEEIEKAIDNLMASEKEMTESDNNDELKVEDKEADVNVQEEQDNSSGVDTKGDKLEEKDTKEVDPALVERAVRAGLSMQAASAMDFNTLEETLSLLEPKQGDKSDTDTGGGSDPNDDEYDIPALEGDEEEWDPTFYKSYNALRDVTARLAKEVKSLKTSGGQSPGEPEWLDAKIGSLDSAYKKAASDPETKKSIASKYRVLSAGYKQEKINIGVDDIFNEAVKAVVGDVVKTKALSDRKNLALQRSSSTSNPKSKNSESESIEQIIARELDEQFFKQ